MRTVCFLFIIFFSTFSFAKTDLSPIDKLTDEVFDKAFGKKSFSTQDATALRIKMGSFFSVLTAANESTHAPSLQRLLTVASYIKYQFPKISESLPVENHWASLTRIPRSTATTDAEAVTMRKVSAALPRSHFLLLTEKYVGHLKTQKPQISFALPQMYLCRLYRSFSLRDRFESCVQQVLTYDNSMVDDVNKAKTGFYLSNDILDAAEVSLNRITEAGPLQKNYGEAQFYRARLTMAKGDIPAGIKIIGDLESQLKQDKNFYYMLLMWRANIHLFEKKLKGAENDISTAEGLYAENQTPADLVNGIKLTRSVLKYFQGKYKEAVLDVNPPADFYMAGSYTSAIYAQLLKAMINRRADPAYNPKSELEFFTFADNQNKMLNPVQHVKIETDIGLILSKPKMTPADITRLETLVKDLKKIVSFCQPILPLFDDFIKSQKLASVSPAPAAKAK